MLLLNTEMTAGLIDLYKSAMVCKHLDLDFNAGKDMDDNDVIVNTDGVIAGVEIVFDIIGMKFPLITEDDVAEFREANGI